MQELEDYLKDVRGNAQTASGVDYWQPEQEILRHYQLLQDNALALGQELEQLNDKKRAGQPLTPEEEQRFSQISALQIELKDQFKNFIDSPDIKAFTEQLKRDDEVYNQTIKLDSLIRQEDELEKLNAVLFYPLVLENRLELVIAAPNSRPIRRTVEGVGREHLNTAITAFRQALDSPHSDALPPAQQLYRWLIEPIEADLAAAGIETIIYAPDGPLRYIPLAALHDGEGWLVERFRINNITAVSLESWDTPPASDLHVLAGAFTNQAVSHQVKGFTFVGLPFARAEVQGLESTQTNLTALYDDDFSLNKVLADIGAVDVLHFATHAALVPGDASESFILFGNGDAPTIRDIEDWPLTDIDLVVLSACETGLGGYDNNGEQILGLGYQFQTQGAEAVMASLWRVSDGGTQILMNTFYSALAQGMGKAEALRVAQRALITGDFSAVGGQRAGIEVISLLTNQPLTPGDNLAHPYYWAPFILIGNGL